MEPAAERKKGPLAGQIHLWRADDQFVPCGVAGIVHGAARATYDVDFVYLRSNANTLASHTPYFRDGRRARPAGRKTLFRGLELKAGFLQFAIR